MIKYSEISKRLNTYIEQEKLTYKELIDRINKYYNAEVFSGGVTTISQYVTGKNKRPSLDRLILLKIFLDDELEKKMLSDLKIRDINGEALAIGDYVNVVEGDKHSRQALIGFGWYQDLHHTSGKVFGLHLEYLSYDDGDGFLVGDGFTCSFWDKKDNVVKIQTGFFQ